MLQEYMLNFRKQVELAFAQESNQLTSVMKHKKVPVRTTKRVEKWFILRDAFRLIERMIACTGNGSAPESCRNHREIARNTSGAVVPAACVLRNLQRNIL
ncbi:hypothetical protein [Paenibacillus macquariensis]|uniref:hypothetical protein n=1 Tax=Paenibacillus macquariensis TaxID=948756 RepID=UPI001481F785|nr:hypothetical protein [Paenibacillus macquariensis]MEC0094198.1 hypothetical protein [Paenibacillus macquariensis]